jgi:pimeloyl-ACP methyl ester carboxylesterase
VSAVEQRVVHVDGIRVFYRRVSGAGPPTVFVHGHPTHSEDWEPFLERLDGPGVALDLPGWGASEDPPGFDHSMSGLARFVERFTDRLGIAEHALVVHDWGAVGLIAALRHPERVRRLVVINAVPLLPGYRWHWVAHWFWRRRLLGELANATTTKAGLRLILRQATPRPGSMPDAFVDSIWATRPPGRWPAALELYRSADPERLAAAGAGLGELRCPALVAWGLDDPYLPSRFGAAYADRLPGAELVELDDAGHWPWIDRPDLVGRIAGFLNGEQGVS